MSVENKKPRVVIVGAGFAGLAAAMQLAKRDVEVMLIDRQNHHLFQPLLYQVATAVLSASDIAWPIRRLTRKHETCDVTMARVVGVDTDKKEVLLESGSMSYDYLILAPGASDSYFGNDHWSEFAKGLKTVDDATRLRHRFLLAFEKADRLPESEQRRALLTVVVVGGGPTGVELAGALAEVAHKSLTDDFRNCDPSSSQIVLVEAGDRLLAGFDPGLSKYALRALQNLRVDVRLNTMVTDVRADGVATNAGFIGSETVIWAAGVAARPVAKWLGIEGGRGGRISVDSHLRAPGFENIYVVGDAADVQIDGGDPLPGIAPVAKQEGRYVAEHLLHRIQGRRDPGPFRYKELGSLATIGRGAAVVDWGKARLRGRIAWWVWGAAHIYFLINLRSRVLVAWQWLWSFLTYDRGARIISGIDSDKEQ